jgi:hypothetical protein
MHENIWGPEVDVSGGGHQQQGVWIDDGIFC